MPVFRSGDGEPGDKPASRKTDKTGTAPPPADAKAGQGEQAARQGEPSNAGGNPSVAAGSEPRNRLQEQAAASPSAGGPAAASTGPAADAPAALRPPEGGPAPQGEPARPWSLLGEINSSVSEAGARTENRILRGLMALDERFAGRQHSMEDALGVVLQDHARTMETIRKEIAAGSDRTVERIAQLEERTYETLSTFIAVLQQIRAELSVLSDSIKALEIETNLAKRAGSRAGGPG